MVAALPKNPQLLAQSIGNDGWKLVPLSCSEFISLSLSVEEEKLEFLRTLALKCV